MISRIFFIIGIICLALYGFYTVQAWVEQDKLEQQLIYESRTADTSQPRPKRQIQEGDLFGRLQIPRLNVSVMIMEGIADQTLRLGVGHIPGTAMAMAAHRDTFFRPLEKIQIDDRILFTNLEGTTEYRVVSKQIVKPTDTEVLSSDSQDVMNLVTCYPFYYIGPAPKRFVVQAVKIPKIANGN